MHLALRNEFMVFASVLNLRLYLPKILIIGPLGEFPLLCLRDVCRAQWHF
jgi:hypothetical protein